MAMRIYKVLSGFAGILVLLTMVFSPTVGLAASRGPVPGDSNYEQSVKNLGINLEGVHIVKSVWYPNNKINVLSGVNIPYHEGRLFLSNNRMLFAVYRKDEGVYDPLFSVPYQDVASVSSYRLGASTLVRLELRNGVNHSFHYGGWVKGKGQDIGFSDITRLIKLNVEQNKNVYAGQDEALPSNGTFNASTDASIHLDDRGPVVEDNLNNFGQKGVIKANAKQSVNIRQSTQTPSDASRRGAASRATVSIESSPIYYTSIEGMPEFKILKGKVLFDDREKPSFAILSLNRKPTLVERKALLKWGKIREECTEEVMSWFILYSDEEREMARQWWYDLKVLTADLYAGKLTYSDYAKKRTNSYVYYDDKMKAHRAALVAAQQRIRNAEIQQAQYAAEQARLEKQRRRDEGIRILQNVGNQMQMQEAQQNQIRQQRFNDAEMLRLQQERNHIMKYGW